MKLMLSVALITTLLVYNANSCQNRPPMPGYQNSMVYNLPWYVYYMKMAYPWQKASDRCTIYELIPTPNDPSKLNLAFKFIAKNGQGMDVNVYANESVATPGFFSVNGSFGGFNMNYQGGYLCAESGSSPGKLMAFESCDRTTGVTALWISFDQRKTPSTLTEKEKSSLAACLQKINITQSSLSLVNNNNCPSGY